MSIVVVNAITVAEESRAEFEQRFKNRVGTVSGAEGFEAFELLRPASGTDRYLVYTRWRSRDDFQAWMRSAQFSEAHCSEGASPGSGGSGSEVWSFEVLEREDAPA